MSINVSPSAAKTGSELVSSARLPLTALSRTVTAPLLTNRPPPSANRPLGLVTTAALPTTSVRSRVRVPKSLKTPPPSASLATPPARLWLTTTRSRDSVPALKIPPPAAKAYGHGPVGQGAPLGDVSVSVGSARLPVTTTSRRVTVAPVVKPAAGGTRIPPPLASTPSPLVRPPVTVSPEIVTVGSLGASSFPIVTTGPPPRIIVRPGADHPHALGDGDPAGVGAGGDPDGVAVRGRV
jgi:hypothetical protein